MTTPVAVILAGGAGTRLWPVSRQNRPKQFIALFSEKTMLEETISRLGPMIPRENVMVVTSKALANGEGYQHLAGLTQLLEPCARNTAPAIGLSALAFVLEGRDPVIAVLPSDHLITDRASFLARLADAFALAEQGNLVTFGITPTHPETGFGYIQTVAAIQSDPIGLGATVSAFKEKPDLQTAQGFLAAGGYFWNSGMFVWRASTILRAIQEHLPELHGVLERIRSEVSRGAPLQSAVDAHFADCPNISIDHGVLEKVASEASSTGGSVTTRLVLVPADIGWSDVGSWDAVYEASTKDGAGNRIEGNGIAQGSTNTHIRAVDRPVVAIGVNDLSIIDTPDALLVCKRGHAQEVRHGVEAVTARGGRQAVDHTTVFRHWGSYTVLEDRQGHKVKRIVVNPGGRLSQQSHEQRAEHWVVVAGEATVTLEQTVRTLTANQSIYIPQRATHRLENKTTSVVELIEVQVGAYFGEDDIQRYDDPFGKVPTAQPS